MITDNFDSFVESGDLLLFHNISKRLAHDSNQHVHENNQVDESSSHEHAPNSVFIMTSSKSSYIIHANAYEINTKERINKTAAVGVFWNVGGAISIKHVHVDHVEEISE